MTNLTALIQQRLRAEYAADPSFYEPSPGQLVDHVHNRVARVTADEAQRGCVEQERALPEARRPVGSPTGDELVRVRDALGDLVDVLSDEMKHEVGRSSYVIEKVRAAVALLGPEYQSYLSAWWLGGGDA